MSFFLDFLKTYVRLPFFLMLGLVACVNGFFLAAKLTALTNLPQALIVLLSFTYIILAIFSLYLFCYALSYVMVLWRVVLVGLLLGVRLFFGGEELFLLHNVTGEESFEEVLGVACLQLLINYCIVINGALSALEVLLLLLPGANSSLVFWHNLEGSIGAASLTSTLDIFKGNAMKNASKLLQYIQSAREVAVPKEIVLPPSDILPQLGCENDWRHIRNMAIPAIVSWNDGEIFLTKELANYGQKLATDMQENPHLFKLYQNVPQERLRTFAPFYKNFALDLHNTNEYQMRVFYAQIYPNKTPRDISLLLRLHYLECMSFYGSEIAEKSVFNTRDRWLLVEGDRARREELPASLKKNSRLNIFQVGFGIRNTFLGTEAYAKKMDWTAVIVGKGSQDALVNQNLLEIKHKAPIKDFSIFSTYLDRDLHALLTRPQDKVVAVDIIIVTDVEQQNLPQLLEVVREKNKSETYLQAKVCLHVCDEQQRKIL